MSASFCGVCGSDIGHADNCSAGYDEERALCGELLAALVELRALVKGECPSLLDEARGGNARLDVQIDALIAKARGGGA